MSRKGCVLYPGAPDAPEHLHADRALFKSHMRERAQTATLTPKSDVSIPYVAPICSDGERSREDRRAFEQHRRAVLRANGFAFEDRIPTDEREQCLQDDESLAQKLESAGLATEPY
jgi:hypothetical protein